MSAGTIDTGATAASADLEGLPLIDAAGELHAIRAWRSGAADIDVWVSAWAKLIRKQRDPAELRALRAANGALLGGLAASYPGAVRQVEAMIDAAVMRPLPAEQAA